LYSVVILCMFTNYFTPPLLQENDERRTGDGVLSDKEGGQGTGADKDNVRQRGASHREKTQGSLGSCEENADDAPRPRGEARRSLTDGPGEKLDGFIDVFIQVICLCTCCHFRTSKDLNGRADVQIE